MLIAELLPIVEQKASKIRGSVYLFEKVEIGQEIP